MRCKWAELIHVIRPEPGRDYPGTSSKLERSMGRARAIADAEQQVADEHIQCATCNAPAQEGKKYCRCCEMYWEDVRSSDWLD